MHGVAHPLAQTGEVVNGQDRHSEVSTDRFGYRGSTRVESGQREHDTAS